MNPEPRDPLIILLALLDEPRSDEDLCDALAAAFRKAPSAAFVHVHGPSLYSRNPNVFREFLVASVETCADAGAGTYDPWRGPEASALNAWLDAADSADDATMFRVLHAWRARSLPAGQRQTVWRQEVSRRFAQCETDETRTIVFAKMKGGGVLDEATAVALYESAPSYSSAFIRRHMPVTTGKSGEYWAELSSRARRRKDQHLFFAVYRRTVEEDQWARDVDLLADRIQPAGELVSELLRRHPYSPRRNVSSVLYALLKKRGDDVVPYVASAIPRSKPALMEEPARHTDLVRLSDERGWLQVWTALLLATGRDVDVDREIRRLVDDRSREEESVLRRLDRIARSVAERGGGRRAMSLSDESASRLYTRFPNLLRTAFRDRIRASGHGYVRLLDAAIHRDDAELVDFIASRVVRIDTRQDWTRTEISPMLESLCAHYEALDRDNGELAVRAARVLGRVHPGDVPRRGYELIADHNRLADLLVRQPLETYLAAPASVRDLLESPDVHARLLAFRILAEDNDRAREIAVDSLDTLRAALFERMPCRVRVQALRALRNAAVNEDLARAIVASARDACDLPAGGYPMEALISLIGHLIHRYPALRGFAEEPAVFAGAPS